MLRRQPRPAPEWTRTKIRALLIGAGLAAVALLAGLVLAVTYAVGGGHPESSPAGTDTPANPDHRGGTTADRRGSVAERRDALAARAMPVVDAAAAEPAPMSTRDPGRPIVVPASRQTGPAGVPSGFPPTPAGALAQLAAIDQTALQSGTLQGAQAVIRGWALPGGPTPTGWSGVRALGEFLDTAELAGASSQVSLVATPLMGQIKGTVGSDFVVPCVDFQVDVTVDRTARVGVADCQRMVWTGGRWMIGPGTEPAPAPSVWPGTDLAFDVGYRNLLPGPAR